MSWYSRYLQVYEKNFDEVAFAGIISEIRSNLKKLQSDAPLVTVSIIAYNEEKHLLACLWALSEMRTRYPIEIIGVNNDSQDRTADVYRAVGLPFYTEMQHSCGHARLCGLMKARGKSLLCGRYDRCHGEACGCDGSQCHMGILSGRTAFPYRPLFLYAFP